MKKIFIEYNFILKNKAYKGSIGCKASVKSEIKENGFHYKCKF